MPINLDSYPRIASVVALGDNHSVEFTYETGERRVLDISHHIRGTWMGELSNPAYFARVGIEPNWRQWIVWPHEQDISPEELYELSVPVED